MLYSVSIDPSETAENRALLGALARQSFAVFVYLAFQVLHPNKKIVPSWHIEHIAYYVEQMFAGMNPPRLVVNLPPRSLKSFILSVCLPAFLLGRDPSTKIICASYSKELAHKLSRDCRALMTSPFYARIFPQTALNPAKSNETELETTMHGYRYATSVSATLTGRGGGWIILDDIMKADDAMSPTALEAVMEWFKHTVRSRLDDPAHDRIIVTQQRLHRDDLSGMLIRGKWPLISIPAIATVAANYRIADDEVVQVAPGDILQPDRMNKEVLDDIKRDVGSHVFESHYQQNPQPDESGYLRREYFVPLGEIDPNDGHQCVISIDPAAKRGVNNSRTAILVMCINRKNYYVEHAMAGQWEINELVQIVIDLGRTYKPTKIIIEDTSSGTALISLLNRTWLADTLLGVRPTLNKAIRVMRQMGKFESRLVKIPDSAPWLPDLLDEFINFPNWRTDDFVDCMVQFMEWLDDEGLFSMEAPLIGIIEKKPEDSVFYSNMRTY